MRLPQPGLVEQVFSGRVQMGVEVVDDPGGNEDPVLIAFVVIAVGGIGAQHAVKNSPRQGGPLGGVRDFVIKSISGNAQAGDRNKDVVLAVGIRCSRFGNVVFVEQAGLPGYLFAVAGAVCMREIGVEQIVTDTHAVEQVAGGEVHVGLGVGIAPDVVAYGGVHVFTGSIEIFLLSFDLVSKGCLGNRQSHFILRAAGFGGRRRRIALQSAHTGQRS